MIAVRVPADAIGATDGQLIVSAWLYPDGARVREGAVLAEIMADKASFELLAPAGGVLRQLVAPETGFEPDAVIAEIRPE